MLSQQLLNGLIAGAVYALFALGFTLMFGVLRVVNLTYGFYFTAGAFVALGLTGPGHLPMLVALPAAGLAVGLLAVVMDHLLVTPLRRARAPELASLMVTLGATLLLYSAMTAVFGTEIKRYPPTVFQGDAYEVAGVRITPAQILILVSTAVAMGLLWLVIERTKLGLAIRALAENADAARLMGISAGWAAAAVSFLSGAMGAMAGTLIGLNTNALQPYMGETMMLKGFAVIIMGGLGSIEGALFAGLALGLLEAFTVEYVASSWKDAVGFILLVLTLWLRPEGLFGRSEVKRA